MDEVFGMLMGREASADSLFAVVDSSYGALKALAASAQTHPTVLMDKRPVRCGMCRVGAAPSVA